jgi:TldD protein
MTIRRFEASFDETIDVADFVVDYLCRKGSTYAEARVEMHSGDNFILKNSVLETASFGTSIGIGVRYIINKTLGFFDTNKLDRDIVRKLADVSLTMTKNSSKISENVHMANDKINKHIYYVAEKKRLANVDPTIKIDYLSELDKQLVDLKNKGIDVSARYFHYDDEIMEKYYTNSEGAKIRARIPRVSLYYIFTIRDGPNTIQRYWHHGNAGGFEFVKNWKLESELPRTAKALYKNMKEGVSAPKENVDIVVAPEVTGIMVHESVGHPYEADRILGREGAQAGESFVTKEMLGTQIGSEIVNAVDDPTLKNSFGYYLYDEEGVAARRKYLIKEGKINEFLQNKETAALFGTRSNGSARAVSYDVEPIIRMSNTFILPGDWTDEEIISDTKKGIFIKNFMEWNIDDVRLNQRYVGNEAYLIENGRVTKPVKRPVVEITTPSLWKSIDAVSNRVEHHAATCGKGEPMQAIPVWHGGPTMRLKLGQQK